MWAILVGTIGSIVFVLWVLPAVFSSLSASPQKKRRRRPSGKPRSPRLGEPEPEAPADAEALPAEVRGQEEILNRRE